jgi:hypothetical protein
VTVAPIQTATSDVTYFAHGVSEPGRPTDGASGTTCCAMHQRICLLLSTCTRCTRRFTRFKIWLL